MQCAAADDTAFVFEDNKVPYGFANLREGARQQSAVARIGRNQFMDMFRIRQNRFTRAHGLPPAATRFSFSPPLCPAALAPGQSHPPRRGSRAPPPVSGSHKSFHRTRYSKFATPPRSDHATHNSFL